MFSQWDPYGERCSISRAMVYSFIYISQSPQLSKEPSHEMGGKIQWPSMEPHVDRKFTNNAVRPGSPRGSFTTLLSLPHCHWALNRDPLHTCYHLPRDPWYKSNKPWGMDEGFDYGRQTCLKYCVLLCYYLHSTEPSMTIWWLFKKFNFKFHHHAPICLLFYRGQSQLRAFWNIYILFL